MGTKHQSSSEPISDNKKRRRTRFSEIDTGIEANQCIKIYLVSSRNEVDSPDCFLLEPIDLNHFFEDDGKIYGYEGLKITIWLSTVSFHAHADISFTSSSNGDKGITDLKSSLQNIFADNLVEKKDDFLETFSTDCHYVKSIISSAEEMQKKPSSGSSRNTESRPEEEPNVIKVLRIRGSSVGHLYCKLVPLVLLLVDGSNPIDVTDPKWDIYILVEISQQDSPTKLLGFAAVYRFQRFPDGHRLRLGQILIIPPYQNKGYGHQLLEVLNDVAISSDAYDLTFEEPVDALQHVRTCIDVKRLLAFDPIRPALDRVVSKLKHENLLKKSEPCRVRPHASIIEQVRQTLKITERQFLQCWEILIYLCLDPIEKYLENYVAIVSDRVKTDVVGDDSGVAGKRLIDIPTEFDQTMSFAMFKCEGGESTIKKEERDQSRLEKQLKQLVEERMEQIKAVASKISISEKSDLIS